MAEFLVRHAATILFVAMAPIAGFAVTVFLITYYLPRDRPKSLIKTRDSLVIIAVQVLTIFIMYPVVHLLDWRSLSEDFGLTIVEFLIGWTVSVVANIVGGYLGNRVALVLFNKIRNGSNNLPL